MKKYNSSYVKVSGKAEIEPKDVKIFEKRLNDEGDVKISLIVGVEAIEDKHTHDDGKFDQILKVKVIRMEECEETE